MALIPLRICSTGKALPSRRVAAGLIDVAQGFKPGYTFDKGGVRERYFAAADETQSQLAACALRDALDNGGLSDDSIDCLISASGVSEQALPSTACAVAAAAGLPAGLPAFDVGASCLSFLMALQVAAGLLATGTYRRIAIVASDLASRGVDWSEPEASLIFGDGAACAIVESGTGRTGIEAFSFQTYTEGRTFCEIRAGGTLRNPRTGITDKDFLFRMDGKAVFKLASRLMPDFLSRLEAQAGCRIADINTVVPHQASHLGMAHLTKRLGLPKERIVNIYETHGNQVAASIPTALHEAYITGRIESGQRVLLIGTAAGLSIGAMVLRV